MNFDTSKYKVWTWKHPFMLHWMINPGLAVNELILGQKVPKISLVEKGNKPLAGRSFVPCPHCGTIHSGLKWSSQNGTAFKNWFGLYCDRCEKIIPCLTNLTSYLVSGLTFPIWYWFKEKWKVKWLKEQKEKFSKPMNLTQAEFVWWHVGLRWGLLMFVCMSILLPLINGEEGIALKSILIGVPIWTLGGLLFGLTMRYVAGGKKSKFRNTKTPGCAENDK